MPINKKIMESKNISGNNFLVAIGVDEYQHFQTSQHRVSELKQLIKILQDKYCFETKDTTVLFDSEASVTNIFKQFETLIATLTKDDTLLILLNGHIVFNKLFRQYFWVPVDALPDNVNQYLSINQFLSLLESFDAFPIYFILDGKIEEKVIKHSFDDLKKENKLSSSKLVLASNQESAESNFNGDSFFLAINKLLKENNSSISASVLQAKLKSSTDSPMIGGAFAREDKGGQFIFELRSNEANDWAAAYQENTIIAYQNFLLEYPNGSFAKEATENSNRIKEDLAWEQAIKENTQQSFLDYKIKYKSGKYSGDADHKIAMLALAIARGEKPTTHPNVAQKTKVEKKKPSFESNISSDSKPKPTKKRTSAKTIDPPTPKQNTDGELEPISTKKEKENSPEYTPPFKKGSNWKKYGKQIIGGLLLLLISLGVYSYIFRVDNQEPPKELNEVKYEESLKEGEIKFNSRQYLSALFSYEIALKYKPSSNIVKTKIDLLAPCRGISPGVCQLIVEMVQIDGGIFKMGSQSGEADERPIHQVSINSFKMSKYEVTQEMYEAVMKENPSEHKGDNLPVTNVSYKDVSSFLKKLNKLIIGEKFRLPTEAEWEYAARGGKQQMPFQFAGHDDPNLVAIHAKNSKGSPKRVGPKEGNTLGLYDMSGNVAEWCKDWYGEKFYEAGRGDNPINVSNVSNSIIIRGGSYLDRPIDCRNTKRNKKASTFSAPYIGFRCVSD